MQALLAMATIVLPLIVWVAIEAEQAGTAILVLAAIGALRLSALSLPRPARWAAVAALAIFCLAALLALRSDPTAALLRTYPVALSLSIGAWFAWTLTTEQPAAARLAQLAGMDVPRERLGYLRNVTRVWAGFLAFNAAAAAWTAWLGTPSQWALYNGLISYLLMGVLFAGEFAVRCWVKRREAQAS